MIKFDTRDDLIVTLPKDMIVCEIGVFKGEFSEKLLTKTNPKELHLIDLFEGVVPSGDKDGNNMVYANLNNEYQILTEKYNNNPTITIHKGSSHDILKKFKDNYFDMIYIDGDHSYEGVSKDLEVSYDKVKSGGYICGHDYTSEKFLGVVNAVNEFNHKYGNEIYSITNDGCPSFCIVNKKTVKP
jgi:hypothetical protein